jgi:hypothetical protein
MKTDRSVINTRDEGSNETQYASANLTGREFKRP